MLYTTMLRSLLVCLFLLIASPALANDAAGFWALRAGGKTLMLFEVVQSPRGWTGTWSQPPDYRTDGKSFRQVKGPAVLRTALEVRAVPGGVELAFRNPFEGAPPDRVPILPRDLLSARMTWAAYETTPYLLTRVSSASAVDSWHVERSYVPDIDCPTDPEMTAIYAADQAARADPASIDWAVVRPADAARRTRTQALLASGRLQSADDHYHAAFVLQHGDAPADYLKAHALAIVAISRGRADASWIAAATLDRYLQSIGQPQIYGTQFRNPGSGFTQEPYARDLLTDEVRQASQVSALADQDRQRREWDRNMPQARKR